MEKLPKMEIVSKHVYPLDSVVCNSLQRENIKTQMIQIIPTIRHRMRSWKFLRNFYRHLVKYFQNMITDP